MNKQPKMITRITKTEFETDDGETHQKILSISEVANILEVSDETVRNLEREGKLIPFYTDGGHRRYYEKEVKIFKNLNMSDTKISIQLYANEYKENNLVKSILNKQFGFELNFENSTERSRRILSLEQVKALKDSIDAALKSYDEAQKFNLGK
jgi:excisionase family DNA binding protein